MNEPKLIGYFDITKGVIKYVGTEASPETSPEEMEEMEKELDKLLDIVVKKGAQS